MFKNVIMICFLVAFAIVGVRLITIRSGSRANASGRPQNANVQPFTAVRSRANFLPGKSVPNRTEFRTLAARSDGSTAELFHRLDPLGSGTALYIKKIVDVPNRQRVVVNPFGESVTTYPLAPETVAQVAVRPVAACDGEPAGDVLGYAVTLKKETVGQGELGEPLDEIVIQSWLAPKLNCLVLRSEAQFMKGGVEIQRTIDTTVSVTEGEPESWLFDIPQQYTERAPSSAMAEGHRRYPNAKGLDCGSCSQTFRDEAYFHAQTHHRQHQP